MRNEGDRFETGDYSFWSRILEPSSEALIESAGVSAGNRVLDVAAGNGNTALVAARRGAIVAALDFSPAQIERGRRRARIEGGSVGWVEGDARRLPFADESFDCSFNSFGDEIAVEEMFRIVRPGGVVGINDWTGDGFFGAMEELYASLGLYAASVPEAEAEGYRPPWGQEDYVHAQMAPHAHRIDARREVIAARFESADSLSKDLLQKDPYLDVIVQELPAERRSHASDELRRLLDEWNRADDGGVLLELNYLMTVATKRETEA
ncbi:MAG TPA: methyltransferase domain-containing protein [Actinomycetota bacterium]|jgi:SAM-dependent methyltransferase|nr:methyltransferase domain-containing protein [Actinomycetota bacterium]